MFLMIFCARHKEDMRSIQHLDLQLDKNPKP